MITKVIKKKKFKKKNTSGFLSVLANIDDFNAINFMSHFGKRACSCTKYNVNLDIDIDLI